MATSSRIQPEQSRAYQGYPFVNPVVIDVPTIDAATAARWTNLPRRPIAAPVHKNTDKPSTNDYDSPSVYVDIPIEIENSGAQTENSSLNESNEKKEDIPVVYIELPEDSENERDTITINQQDRGQENPAFVEETIFFDPFENRQIDVNKSRETPQGDDVPGDGPAIPGSSATRPALTISEPGTSSRPTPNRPTTLNLSGLQGGSASTTPSVTGFIAKESQVYGCSGSSGDGFTLTPLEVTEYPEPPPAYTEVATTTGRQPGQANNTAPPRTVVVLPEPSPTLGLPSADRKYVQCQNCRMRVHTVVAKENGPLTHMIALITMILCLLPITVVIYCTDFFKYRVHFCPNCNHRVGYEVPILCQSMVFN